jgi:vesicle-associated membrane protein 7
MIIYSLVAKGTFILAEYTTHDGDFPEIARKLLAKTPKSPIKKTFLKENYSFTIFSIKDFSFLVLTDSKTSRGKTHRFLDALSEICVDEKNEKNRNSAQLTVLLKKLMVIQFKF